MQREVLEFARGERTLFVRRVYLHKFFGDLRRQLELELNGQAHRAEAEHRHQGRGALRRGARGARRPQPVRATPSRPWAKGGVLTLKGKLDGKDLLIAVTDTGPGIPPAIEHRLFQSFVTLGKEGGTGLGLAIVKKIVEEHGGTVQREVERARRDLRAAAAAARAARASRSKPQQAVRARARRVSARPA